jgi:hypothetical protein
VVEAVAEDEEEDEEEEEEGEEEEDEADSESELASSGPARLPSSTPVPVPLKPVPPATPAPATSPRALGRAESARVVPAEKPLMGEVRIALAASAPYAEVRIAPTNAGSFMVQVLIVPGEALAHHQCAEVTIAPPAPEVVTPESSRAEEALAAVRITPCAASARYAEVSIAAGAKEPFLAAVRVTPCAAWAKVTVIAMCS